MLAYKLIRTPNQVILPLLIVAWKLTQLEPCPCTGLYWEPSRHLSHLAFRFVSHPGSALATARSSVIAALFVLIPGVVASLLIRRPAQAPIPLLIVALRLRFWKIDSYPDYESLTIYETWLSNLLCLLAARLHAKLG